jgi:hypothetical protein
MNTRKGITQNKSLTHGQREIQSKLWETKSMTETDREREREFAGEPTAFVTDRSKFAYNPLLESFMQSVSWFIYVSAGWVRYGAYNHFAECALAIQINRIIYQASKIEIYSSFLLHHPFYGSSLISYLHFHIFFAFIEKNTVRIRERFKNCTYLPRESIIVCIINVCFKLRLWT